MSDDAVDLIIAFVAALLFGVSTCGTGYRQGHVDGLAECGHIVDGGKP